MKSAVLILLAILSSQAYAEKDVGNGWGNGGPQIQSGQPQQQQQQSSSQQQTQSAGGTGHHYSSTAGSGPKKPAAVSIEEIACEQEGGKINLEIKVWLRDKDYALTGELPGVSLRASDSGTPLWGAGYEFYRKKEKRHYFAFMPVQKEQPLFYFVRERGKEAFPGFLGDEKFRCRYSKRADDVSRIGF